MLGHKETIHRMITPEITCYFCKKIIGKKKGNMHHIYGRKRSRQKALSHKGCHDRFHRDYEVYEIPFPEEAKLLEVKILNRELVDKAREIKTRLKNINYIKKHKSRTGD